MMRAALAAALAWLPVCAAADEDRFVEANLVSILYHELGHAMIDLLRLPVYGQEEDAADVASILLIHALFAEDSARAIAADAARGFEAEARVFAETGDAPAYWAVHGPDTQRFYNTVCLFYGGDAARRDRFARSFDLPGERAETCEEEFALAIDSWGAVFDELADAVDSGAPLRLREAGRGLTADVVRREVADLNARFGWPERLDVTVDRCGEANAFYDPVTVEIVMCREYEPYLRDLYRDVVAL